MMNINQKSKGFTLVETLVSLLIFGFVSIIMVNIFVSVLNSQRRILQNQELMNSSSYALEYMARAIRMAEKDVNGYCTGTPGKNYLPGASDASISFLAYDAKTSTYKCTQFLLEGAAVKERKSTTESIDNLQAAQPITSSSVNVSGLTFAVTGNAVPDSVPPKQPKVTIMIKMSYNTTSANAPGIVVQTSISQRKLDI